MRAASIESEEQSSPLFSTFTRHMLGLSLEKLKRIIISISCKILIKGSMIRILAVRILCHNTDDAQRIWRGNIDCQAQ